MKVKDTRTFDIIGLSALEYACIISMVSVVRKYDLIKYYANSLPLEIIEKLDNTQAEIYDKLINVVEVQNSSDAIKKLLKEI